MRTLFSRWDDAPYKAFVVYFLGYILITALLPAFFIHTTPVDAAQNVAWSHTWSWGYSQHPPLGTVLLKLMLWIVHNIQLACYLSNSLCMIVAFLYLYRLSALFLSRHSAMVVTIISTLSLFYISNFALDYDQNTIMLPFWAMSAYYLLVAMRDNKWRHWVILAVVATLSMLAKYESAIVLLAEFLYLACRFKRAYWSRIIVAFVIFIVLLIPHIIWLFQTGFLTFQFVLGELQAQSSFWARHVHYPLTVLYMLPTNSVLSLVICLALVVMRRVKRQSFGSLLSYPAYLGWAPLVIVALVSGIWGEHIHVEWAYPLMFFTILGLAIWTGVTEIRVKLKSIVITALVFQVLSLGAYIVNAAIITKMTWTNAPSYTLAKAGEQFWRQYKGNAPIRYAGGVKSGGIGYYLPAYLPSKPSFLSDLSLHRSPWIDRKAIARDDALIVYSGCPKQLPRKLQVSEFAVVHKQCINLPLLSKFKPMTKHFTLAIVQLKS